MSPAEREARQEQADRKERDAAEKAYNRSLTKTELPADPRDAVRGQKGYAKGGVTRADGCVTKGHTKGTMVKMAYGGKTC